MDSFVTTKQDDEINFTHHVRGDIRRAMLAEILEENPNIDITDSGFLDALAPRVNASALERTAEMEETQLVKRSLMQQAADAEHNGWHHHLEYDTVEEMLIDRAGDYTSRHIIYEIKQITEVIIPLAREAGVDESVLWHISSKEAQSLGKLRVAVPTFRQIQQMKTSKQKKELTKRLIQQIANPNVPVREFKKMLSGEDTQTYNFREFYQSKDRSYIICKVENEIQRRAIKRSLEKLPDAEVGITDIVTIINELSQLKRK